MSALLAASATVASAGVTPWNVGSWARLTPPDGPLQAVYTYDPSHDRAIAIPLDYSPPGETWQAFNAGRFGWSRVIGSPSAPPPPLVRGAIYDPHHDGLVVFARSPEGPATGPGTLSIWRVESKGVGEWNRIAVEGDAPADRANFAVVSDTRRHRLVLFGGGPQRDDPEFADTWTLDLAVQPARWNRVPLGIDPPARAGMTAAFDSVSDRMYVFGGGKRLPNGGGISPTNELWSLDLAHADRWDSVGIQGVSPGPGFGPVGLATVPGMHRLLMCGRALQGLAIWALDLDGSPTWTKLADAPESARHSSVFLLGPTHDGRWSVLTYPAQSWTFDLTRPGDWRLEGAAFASGPEDNRSVLLADPVSGGSLATIGVGSISDEGGTRVHISSDVWRLSAGLPPRWERIDDAGAGPVEFRVTGRVFDSRRLRWILFGVENSFPGFGPLSTWALSVGPEPRWTRLEVGGEIPRNLWGAGIAYDALRDRIVAFGGGRDTGSTDVSALDLGGEPRWHMVPNQGRTPHTRSGALLTRDPARDRFLMFGGGASHATPTTPWFIGFFDTWALRVGDTATWDSLETPGSPLAGANSDGFYDPARDAVDMFGPIIEGPVGLFPNQLLQLPLVGPPRWGPASPDVNWYPPGGIDQGYAFEAGGDHLVQLAFGKQLWILDRGQPTHEVLVDLSPGDPMNTLRADAHGLVTAAILGSPAFDARTLDPASVTLAGATAHVANAADRASLRDVNHDGFADRVLRFARADMTLDPAVGVVALTGRTRAGEAVVGWDLYRLVGSGGAGGAASTDGRGIDADGLAAEGDPDAPVDGPTRLSLTVPGPARGAVSVRLAVPVTLAGAAGIGATAGGVLEVFSVDGRRVARHALDALTPGTRTIALEETRGLASGVYFARVRLAGGQSAIARFVLLR